MIGQLRRRSVGWVITRAGLSVVVVFAALGLAGQVRAADPAFGTPTASSTYGSDVTFEQPYTPSRDVKRVEILLSSPGSLGPLVATVRPPTSCCSSTTFRYSLRDAEAHLTPNTRFSAQWRVTDADGTVHLGDPTSVLYADTRFDWKTVSGPIVRVHWYDGPAEFGQRALAIGEKGVDQAAKLLGVTETAPVDFYIYADQKSFYDALGPGTRENVGGEAHADIRTMFALIQPDEINAAWVSTVVPHELTHLVFDTAVKNPYHFPPHWLNEGLAVYLSEAYGSDSRSGVEDAVRGGRIIPLDGLTGQFPTTRDQFFLAYDESVSAVDYLVRTYGRDALVKLVRSFADGVTDDEAFRAGIGQDFAAFQAGWLADLGAKAPAAVGPRPGPPGPLPSGWTGAPAKPGGAGSDPGAAAPDAGASPDVAQGGGALPPPVVGGGPSAGSFVVVGLDILVVLLVMGFLGHRQSRRLHPRPAASAAPVDEPYATVLTPYISASATDTHARTSEPPGAPGPGGDASADRPPFGEPSQPPQDEP